MGVRKHRCGTACLLMSAWMCAAAQGFAIHQPADPNRSTLHSNACTPLTSSHPTPLTPPPVCCSSKPDADDIRKRREVLLSGLVTALGIALHNFPEGVAVYLASLKSHAVGASLAAAIALHNIPEGVAVALPVYFATGSRMQGLKYAVLSGLAEPLGVLVLACFTVDMNKGAVECMLAAVGGIMAFLAMHELLPLAIEHAGRKPAVLALFAGMAVMSANLYLLDHWIGQGTH